MKQDNKAGGRPGLIGRRDLIAMVGGAAVAWPLAARAQERALPLIGFLNGGAADRSKGFLVGVPRGLNEMGFVEGRNFAAEYRWADDHLDRLPALAADLVQRRVAVIVTGGGPQPALAAKAATSTIPIVFFTGDDPVKFGLVPRYNRPGSNLTGFNFMISELEQKRVGLLHELVPTAGVVAALCDPHGSGAAAIFWRRWRAQPNPLGSNWFQSMRAIRHSSTPLSRRQSMRGRARCWSPRSSSSQ